MSEVATLTELARRGNIGIPFEGGRFMRTLLFNPKFSLTGFA